MPGAGFARKPYYLNFNKEAAFDTEPASTGQTAVSGEIQDTPSFSPKNDPIKTKRHSELGANSNVLKGRFSGTISLTSTIQDFRSVYRLWGRTIDQPTTFTVNASAGGDFVATDSVERVSDSEVLGIVASVSGTGTSQVITLEEFDLDETVNSGGGTGVGGTLYSVEFDGTDYIATLYDVTTAYIVGDTLTGATSTAARGITAVGALASGVQALTLATIIATDNIDDGATKTATVAAITVWNHRLGVHYEQPSYSVNYAYETLNDQHVMSGTVMQTLKIESAVNEAPKMSEDWRFASSVIDSTRDAEVTNTRDLYEYVDIDDLINAIVYTDVLKSTSMTFTRSNQNPLDSHQGLAPTGFKGAEVESKVNVEIHREDTVLLTLASGDTEFPLSFTWTRTAITDLAVFTFPTCKFLEPDEAGEETILLTVPIEIKGTPTANIHDNIPDYTT